MKKLCQLGSSSFNVQNTNITIQYPGYKRNGDYKLLLNGNPPTHVDICCTLHNYIMQNPNEYTKISRLLEDVYQNGTNCIGNYNLQNYDADYLINLIFLFDFPYQHHRYHYTTKNKKCETFLTFFLLKVSH